jgi:hypothetical protein
MIISSRVWSVCAEHAISAEELQMMIDQAALYTQEPGFNRRFHHWLLDIREGQCHNLSMAPDTPVYIGTPGKSGYMEEEHLDCDGLGCGQCKNLGRVRRWL